MVFGTKKFTKFTDYVLWEDNFGHKRKCYDDGKIEYFDYYDNPLGFVVFGSISEEWVDTTADPKTCHQTEMLLIIASKWLLNTFTNVTKIMIIRKRANCCLM